MVLRKCILLIFILEFLLISKVLSQKIEIHDSTLAINTIEFNFICNKVDSVLAIRNFTHAVGKDYKIIAAKRNNTLLAYSRKGILLSIYDYVKKREFKKSQMASIIISYKDTLDVQHDLHYTSKGAVRRYPGTFIINGYIISENTREAEIYNLNLQIIDTLSLNEPIAKIIICKSQFFKFYFKFISKNLIYIEIILSPWHKISRERKCW